MKRTAKFVLAIGVLAALGGGASWAAGLYGNLPGVGQPSYCTSTSTGPTGSPVCVSTVPAGPTVFAGTEYSNFDLGPLGGTNGGSPPQSYAVSLLQLGQGPLVDLTTVGTTQTIPNNTPFYLIDGTQAAAFTVTMPPNPVEGQFQRVVCEAATAGALTVAGNTGQTVRNSPGVACVAGAAPYIWRYSAASATWFKV